MVDSMKSTIDENSTGGREWPIHLVQVTFLGPLHDSTPNHYRRQRLGYTIGRNVRSVVGRTPDVPATTAVAWLVEAGATASRSRLAKRRRDQSTPSATFQHV